MTLNNFNTWRPFRNAKNFLDIGRKLSLPIYKSSRRGTIIYRTQPPYKSKCIFCPFVGCTEIEHFLGLFRTFITLLLIVLHFHTSLHQQCYKEKLLILVRSSASNAHLSSLVGCIALFY